MRLARVAAIAGMLTLLLAGPAAAGDPVALLSVTKTDSPDPVAAGANLTYTITVQNLGPSTAPNVSLSDTLPAGTTFVSLIGAGGLDRSPRLPVGWHWHRDGRRSRSLTVAAGAQSSPSSSRSALVSRTGRDHQHRHRDERHRRSRSRQQHAARRPRHGRGTRPVASLADAAMPAPSAGSPLAILGFAVLLVGLLTSTAVLAARRIRS